MKKAFVFLFAAVLGVSAGLLLSMCFQITEVTDHGMLPSYEEGQHVLVRKQAFSGDAEFQSGDVVLIENWVYTASGEGSVSLKRVGGTAGDTVMITSGLVYVNGKVLAEPYVFTQGISGEMDEVEVPEGTVFVLGDNRAASTDSRNETVGMVDEEKLLGKVIFTW